MKRDESILQKLVSRFSLRWQKQARLAVKRLYELLGNGMTATAAVSRLSKEYSDLFKLDGLEDMLLEAACYGYGIMPSVLTADQRKEWGKQLADKWDASGMKLSEKIHGAGVKMRSAIIDTLQAQMFHSKTWTDTARALYDGYSKGENAFTGGRDIISRQELPQYIQKVLLATGDSETAVAQQLALENINKLAKGGAPNKALQTAYNELLEAVQEGNEKAIEKAVETAINEKSRYVAERIARTEMARAYADGFIAKIKDDPDIVAVKFKLGSRHPAFDICDMYARADMFNLGKGVYPKDKLPPLPIHPHCLCRYSEVIDGEVDTGKVADNVQNAGDKWLEGLTEYQRRAVLGVEGAKAWQEGADWRKYMRGYAGLKEVGSRLAKLANEKATHKNYVVQETERENIFVLHDLKHGIIKEEKSIIKGEPLSISEITTSKGGKSWDFCDANGDVYLQVSDNDHGHKKEAKLGEHGEHCHWYYKKPGEKHSTHGEAEEIPRFVRDAMKELL